jgi:hypothetical protein
MKSKIPILTLTFVAVITVSLVFLFTKSSASFTPNNLMDDQVFDNTTSMSAVQIDGFLNSFPSSCISTKSNFTAPDPTGYSPSTGFTFGNNVSAGTVIYDASQAYDINPQILLATMEKEQSLITGDLGCTQHQYNAAMGYGCPDGGTCPDSPLVTGFSQQVIHAAWLLKFSEQRSEGNINFDIDKGSWNNSDDPTSRYTGPMTQGTYQTCPGDPSVYYDGYTTIDGQSVYMTNGATAALYNYTPHFPGNENFDSIFITWFGSIVGTDLVRSLDNATVYLVNSTNKYPIADGNVLNDFSNLGPISYVTDAYLASLTTGSLLGHMVGDPISETLYFVNADIKLPFTSCTQVTNYGYSCSSVIYLMPFQLNQLYTGPYMTSFYQTTTGKNFYINNGQKDEIFSQQSAVSAGLSPSYNTLLEGGIAYLPYGPPVIQNQVVALDRNTGTEYYYENNTFTALNYNFASLPAFSGLPQANLYDASINEMTVNNNFLGFMVNTEDTQYYALTQNGKALLTSPAQWAATSNFSTFSDSFLSSIQTDSVDSINNMIVKSPSSGTVYYITGATKRAFPSWADLVDLNPQPLTITTIPNYELSQITSGALAYGPSSLVKSASSATVYVVKDVSDVWPLTTFTISQELGLNSPTRIISSSDLSAYTVLSNLQPMIACNSNDYVGISGTVYPISSSGLSSYGFTQSQFIDGGGLCSLLKVSSQQLSSFILTTNGTIYLVTAGQKDPIAGYQTYLNDGGAANNTLSVSNYFASTIPTGPTVY